MGKVYDEFEQLSMGGKGRAPVGFAEAVYQANINDRLENMPGLKEHFDNTKHLASFSSGNTEDARKYNLLNHLEEIQKILYLSFLHNPYHLINYIF